MNVIACCMSALALAGTLFSPNAVAATKPGATSTDLVVYGGTASGVMTAYGAAKQGIKVILLNRRIMWVAW